MTANILPATPILNSPGNGIRNASTNIAFSWNPAAGAATYRLQVTTDPSFSTRVFDDSTLTTTIRAVTSLAYNTTFYWRVKAKNPAGSSAWSSVWSFTTTLAAPTLLAPLNGATGVSTSPVLSWNPTIGATSYRLQVSTNTSFSTTVIDQSGIANALHSVSGLANNTKYYWRVAATNAGGDTGFWSSVWNFTTSIAPPSVPMLATPSNGAVDQPINLTLSWNPLAGAATYRLQVSTNSVFTTTIADDSSITSSSRQIDSLANNTTYYWHVKAKNAGGTSPWSETWSFTTTPGCLRNGDVNNDGALTPGDALCAFNIYLNNGNLTPSCDVTGFACEASAADVSCDDAVTPGDALAIFQRYLQNLPLQECFGKSTLAKHAETKRAYQLSLQRRVVLPSALESKPETLCLSLVVDNPAGLSALGLALSYPKDKLAFSAIKRTVLTKDWHQLEGRASSEGKIIVGGFNERPIAQISNGEICQILFAIKDPAFDPTELTLSDLVDDFSEATMNATEAKLSSLAAIPASFKLHQSFPNPFHVEGANRVGIVIRFDLPGENPVNTELAIYNLVGQLVQCLTHGMRSPGSYEVTWNGVDESGRQVSSGMYWYHLQAGNFKASKRLLLAR